MKPRVWMKLIVGASLSLILAFLAIGAPKRSRILGIRRVEIQISDPEAASRFYRILDVVGDCSDCKSAQPRFWLLLPNSQSVLLSSNTSSESTSSLLRSIGFETDD